MDERTGMGCMLTHRRCERELHRIVQFGLRGHAITGPGQAVRQHEMHLDGLRLTDPPSASDGLVDRLE